MNYFLKSNFGIYLYFSFKYGVMNNSSRLIEIFCPLSMSPEHMVEVSIEQAEYTGDKVPKIMTNKKTFILPLNIP